MTAIRLIKLVRSFSILFYLWNVFRKNCFPSYFCPIPLQPAASFSLSHADNFIRSSMRSIADIRNTYKFALYPPRLCLSFVATRFIIPNSSNFAMERRTVRILFQHLSQSSPLMDKQPPLFSVSHSLHTFLKMNNGSICFIQLKSVAFQNLF